VFRTTDYALMFQLAMTTLGFALPAEIGIGYLRMENRSGQWNVMVIGRQLTIVGLHIAFLVVAGMGMIAMMWAPLIALGLLLSVVWLCWIRPLPVVLDVGLARRMASFSLPLAFSGMGMLVVHYGDRFFLQRWASLTEIGLYALAYKLGMLVAFVHGPFSTYWQSQMYSIVRSSPRETYVRTLTYVAFMVSLSAVGLAAFSRPAVRLLAAPEYWEVTKFVAPLAGAYAFRSVGEHLSTVFYVNNRTRVNLRVILTSVAVNLACYAVLIPRWKVWGAVLATLFTFIWMTIHSWVEAQRIERYDFEYGRLARIAASGVAAVLLPVAWTPDNFALQLFAGLTSVSLFLILLLASGFLNQDESRMLRERVAQLRRLLQAT
jgi:O-antigen/teichoic acid export membrane protein